MKAVCQALGLARSNIHRLQARPESWIDARTRRTAPASDVALLDEIKAQIIVLPTYGYRRACALVNRHRATTGAPHAPAARRGALIAASDQRQRNARKHKK